MTGGTPTIIWKQCYGYAESIDEVIQIFQNADENIIALSQTQINNRTFLTTLEVNKLNGSILQQSNYAFQTPLNANKIIQTRDRRNYMIVGTVLNEDRSTSVFVCQLDLALNLNNYYIFSDRDRKIFFEGVAIIEDTPELGENNFIVLGRKTDPSLNDSENLLFGFDTNTWTINWEYFTNIFPNQRELLFPRDLILDERFNCVITGKYLNEERGERKAFLMNIEANRNNGVLNWAMKYLDESESESVTKDGSPGYALVGKIGKKDDEKFYLVSTDLNGHTSDQCESRMEFELTRQDYQWERSDLERQQEFDQMKNSVKVEIPELREDDACRRCTMEIMAVAEPPEICAGQQVYMTVSGGTSYTWSPAVTYVAPNGSSVTANPTVTTTYTVTGTNDDGCTGTTTVTVTVYNPLYTANAGSDITIILFQGSCVQIGGPPIVPADGDPNPTYNWTPSGGLNATNVPNPTACPTVTTTYTLTVTDHHGCSTSDQVTVSVIVPPPVYRALSKKLDGGYYKPVNNKLYFKFEEEYKNGNLDYKIYDKGRNVISCATSPAVTVYGDNRYMLDVGACPGLLVNEYYTLEVTNEKKELFQLRFVK